MKHTLFAGCSYTAGTGFEEGAADPRLWVNILHSTHPALSETNLLNVSQGGRSNAGIFADATYHMLYNECSYAFVAWTSVPRYEMDLGLETYSTRQVFLPNGSTRDHHLNDITYTKKYLADVRDRFTTLAHLHYEISELVYYINSLVAIAERTKTKLFFINALCPWDQDFFNQLYNTLPDQYTNFTKNLISVDTRDDCEVFEIYAKMHNAYNSRGGVHQTRWLNLYSSMKSQLVDTNSDGMHPGEQSNKLYASDFIMKLTDV